ncbi:MAG TPA: FAD-dependent oxidoreductase, partial [Gemmatimonadaceae bacterium]|nr:FAD-dependent oxidoreductase [Gemmatimonadaceae bacterium]
MTARAARPHAIVVGGGPAGCATAWRLARAGAKVLLLDRARFPRDKACAEYLSPEASRLLADMGALERVERAGAAQLAGMLVRAPSGATIRGEFAAAHGFHAFRDRGLAIRRTRLDAELLETAREGGVTVREGVRAAALVRDGDGRVRGVETIDAGGRRVALLADLVIGADGLRSVVARRLGLARASALPRRVAVVGHYAGVLGLGEMGEMHVERDGYCGMANVGLGESNLAVVVPAGHARAMAGDPAGFLDQWVARHPQLRRRFRRARRLGRALVTGPFAHHARRAWAPGAALVGDAADYFDPFTGEGIYAALRGAELLAPAALAALGAPSTRAADRALASYHA